MLIKLTDIQSLVGWIIEIRVENEWGKFWWNLVYRIGRAILPFIVNWILEWRVRNHLYFQVEIIISKRTSRWIRRKVIQENVEDHLGPNSIYYLFIHYLLFIFLLFWQIVVNEKNWGWIIRTYDEYNRTEVWWPFMIYKPSIISQL
jgi:hypothetical protein